MLTYWVMIGKYATADMRNESMGSAALQGITFTTYHSQRVKQEAALQTNWGKPAEFGLTLTVQLKT